ncbi:transposase [Bacillus luteolus]|uniref:Transposase n=1 Tax=Litchfieldia luteola TaxID=682179 RepID=A0ABR9QFP4_9BACI|nr:transposase [Cytobacillus luteolus]MBP1943469.1 REP element-mobilizing transposase RayT [Cytobacillus luteolus]
MSRKRKKFYNELFYHVVSRGVRREAIFINHSDFSAFLYILNQTYDQFSYELPSYCLMNNHYHLLIRIKSHSLAEFMHCLNKRYASYFNNKYGYSGRVFDHNYFSSAIYTYESLLKVSKYIHLNPLRAHLVKDLVDYPWSSYSFYKSGNVYPPTFIPIAHLLDTFNGTINEQRRSYCDFVEE